MALSVWDRCVLGKGLLLHCPDGERLGTNAGPPRPRDRSSEFFIVGFFTVGISSTDLGALRSGEYFQSWDFFTVGISSTDLGALRSGGYFHDRDVFTVGIYSTDLGALRSGKYFHGWDFSQLGFPPPISALSDRAEEGSVTICLSPAKAVFHRSEPCEIGAGFVGRESSLNGPPRILTVRDRGRFCWSGVFVK